MKPIPLVAVAFAAGVGALMALAPDYLLGRGFPLDDAWIHAVYARSLAQTAQLAYNPGVPATGETSPLWAALLAVPHAVVESNGRVVALSKCLGLSLHFLTALLFVSALGREANTLPLRLAGACVVAFHPDLISAAASGMEVPLACLVSVLLLREAQRSRFVPYLILSGMAPLARPEIGLFVFLLPIGLGLGHDRERLWRLGLAATLGSCAALGATALRNLAVSGAPLPATFYAKAGHGLTSWWAAESVGFGSLLGKISIADSPLLLLGGLGVSVAALVRADWKEQSVQPSAVAFATGIVFCGISFILVPPVDANAFYHQRYVLPALPFLVGTLPLLLDAAFQHWSDHWRPGTRLALIGLFLLSMGIEASNRYPRLENDAHNIDDVQVAMGRSLANAAADDVLWVTDAGALRFFGQPFVVDLMGLNSPALLGPGAQQFLDDHPPRYLGLLPAWTSVAGGVAARLPVARFSTTTPYTVTSFPAMATQELFRCTSGVSDGQLRVRGRLFSFRCAEAGNAVLP